MAFDELMVFYVLVFDGFGELMVLDELTCCRVLSGLTALMSVMVWKVLMSYHDE